MEMENKKLFERFNIRFELVEERVPSLNRKKNDWKKCQNFT